MSQIDGQNLAGVGDLCVCEREREREREREARLMSNEGVRGVREGGKSY